MDIFETAVMLRVIRELHNPLNWFCNRYFPSIITFPTEEVKFDTIKGGLKLAPYVSPDVAGRITRSQGFKTDTFTPAYTKDKSRFKPNQALKRMAGEKIGGSLSPKQRQAAALKQSLQDKINALARRREQQATEIGRTGKVIIEGEDYPRQEVDFRRDAALSVTVASGDKWSVDGADPLEDLQKWSYLVLTKGFVRAVDVVMTADVWAVFRKNPIVKDLLDTRKADQEVVKLDMMTALGGQFMGTIGGFNIFVYQDVYENDSGVVTPYIPDGTVWMGSPAIDGAQCFGAIQDVDAIDEGKVEGQYYPKSWTEKDPSIRMLMLQSAPLVVPLRPNAMLCASGVV